MLRAAALAAILALAAAPAFAFDRPRDCTAEEADKRSEFSYFEAADHRQFTLPAIVYDYGAGPKEWRPYFHLLVDESGRVVCVNLAPYGRPVELTPQRVEVLKQFAAWTYRPFEVNGAPAAVMIDETLDEEERPGPHQDMPEGDLAKASITLTRSNCYGSCPAYHVRITGGGKVEFKGSSLVNVPGKHTYHIAPDDAAALFRMARDKDIWSMRDSYEAEASDFPTYALRIEIGGKAKTISDFVGSWTGMPHAVTEMENAVDKAANTDVFIHFQAATFPYLEAEHFKFRGQPGANLLLSSIGAGDEDALVRLVELGAPLQGGKTYEYGRAFAERPVVSLAIKARQDRLLDTLLAHNALTPGGIPYQTLIDDAFQAAVESGQMRYIEKIWPYSPRTTVKAQPAWDGSRAPDYPVCLKLGGTSEDAKWDGLAIVAFLFDHNGCDVSSHEENEKTILHVAAEDNARELISYLINKGADINAKGHYGDTPLCSTMNEDTIIALLEAGADPTIKNDVGADALGNAVKYHQTRVLAWLTAHGYALPES